MIKLLGTLAAGLFAVLAAPASAQLSTTANGPYYATPSWDQKLTTNRFVILANWNNEAVLDRETGLVWQKIPASGGTTYAVAVQRCLEATTGNRAGWRLPTAAELRSLVDGTQNIVAGAPFSNVTLDEPGSTFGYWTTTPTPASHIIVTFYAGGTFPNGIVDAPPAYPQGYRWCVRGPE
jgi:hypothetical protein